MMLQPEILKNKMPSCYSRCSACAWEYNDFHSPIWITAFRNGDKHHHGTRFLVSPARQRNFEGLLDSLTKRLEPPFGAVRQVYSPCSGNAVKCLKDLKPNHKYVAAGKESLRKMSNGYLTYDEKFKKRHKCNHKREEIYKPEKGKSLRERYSNIQSKYLEDAERRRKGTMTIFVHRNKDFDNRPIRFVLSEKDRTSLYWWGPTMQSIASKLQMSSIKGFFTINGEAVHIPCHLQHGEIYVAVSRMEKFQKGPYKRAEVMIPHKSYHNNCLGHLSVCSSDFECEQLEISSEEEEEKDEARERNIFQRPLTKQSHLKETRKENNAETKKSGHKEGKIKPTYVRISHHFMKEVNSNQEHKCLDSEYVPTARHQCPSNHERHEDMSAFDNKKEINQNDDLEKNCDDVEKEVISKSKHMFDCFPLCHNSSTSINRNDANNVDFNDQKFECEGLCQTVEMNHSKEPEVQKNDELENNMSMEKIFEEVIEEQENEIPCDLEEIVAHSCHGFIEPKTGSSHHSVVHHSTTIIFQKKNESDELSTENIPSEEFPFSLDPSSVLNGNSESHTVVSCCDCYPVNHPEESLTKKEVILKKAKSKADDECQASEMVQLTKIVPSPQTSCHQTRREESPVCHKDAITEPCKIVKMRAEEKEIQTESDNEVPKEPGRKKKSKRSCCACFPLCKRKDSSVSVKNASTEADTSDEMAKKSSHKEAEMQTDSEYEESNERKRKRKSKRSCCACFPLCRRKDSSVSVKNASTEADISGKTARKLNLKEAEMQTDGVYEESNGGKRKRKSKKSCCACLPLCRREDSSVSVKNASTEANLVDYSDKTAKKINIIEAESQTDDLEYKSSPESGVKFKEEEVETECSSDEENMPNVSDEKIVSWYALQNEKIYMRKAKGINNIIVSYTYKENAPGNRRLCSRYQVARKKDNNKFLFGLKKKRKPRLSVKKKCKKSHPRKKKRGKIISRPCARWDWGKRPRRHSLQRSEPSFSVPYNIGYVKSSGLDHLIFENPQSTDTPMNLDITEPIKNDTEGNKSEEIKTDEKKDKPTPSVKTPRKYSQKKPGNKKHPPAKSKPTLKADKILEEEYLKEKFEPYSGNESDLN